MRLFWFCVLNFNFNLRNRVSWPCATKVFIINQFTHFQLFKILKHVIWGTPSVQNVVLPSYSPPHKEIKGTRTHEVTSTLLKKCPRGEAHPHLTCLLRPYKHYTDRVWFKHYPDALLAHSTLAAKSLEIHSVHKLYVAYHTLSSPLCYYGNVLYSSLAYRRCVLWSYLLADPAM